MPIKNKPALTMSVSVMLEVSSSFLCTLSAISSAYFHRIKPLIMGNRIVADKITINSGVNKLFIFPEKTTGRKEYNVVKIKYKESIFINKIENGFIKPQR